MFLTSWLANLHQWWPKQEMLVQACHLQMNYVVLVLMKLSQSITNQDLAYHFGIDMSKVAKVFHMWIDVLAANMKSLIKWPDREMI